MPMVKKSISITDRQDDWVKTQIETGHFGNESEVFRELIRERQMREQETPAMIEALRTKLIKAEQAGFVDKTPEEMLAGFKKKARENGEL